MCVLVRSNAVKNELIDLNEKNTNSLISNDNFSLDEIKLYSNSVNILTDSTISTKSLASLTRFDNFGYFRIF